MSGKRIPIVSLDCHIDPATPDVLATYMDPRYRSEYLDYEKLLAGLGHNIIEDPEGKVFDKNFFEERERQTRSFFSRMGYDEPSYRHRVSSMMSFTSDPEQRLRELEADGVVAELLFSNGVLPFQTGFGVGQSYSPAHRLAGVMAYNRWIADICRAHPGRRFGVAQLPSCADVDEVVRIIEWAAGEGFKGVMCPQADPALPALHTPYYEPIWRACAENDLPLHCHVGWGIAVEPLRAHFGANIKGSFADPVSRGILHTETYWLSRRMLWVLIFSGAFDRHPNLKLMFVEQHADWVPGTLKQLDQVHDMERQSQVVRDFLKRRPSEYWADHCLLGASLIAREEVGMRHEIGISTVGFGTDYPHLEATWPNTLSWLNSAFEGQGVTEQEARDMLGGNAIRFYNLDQATLQQAADKVGPTPESLLVPDRAMEPSLRSWMEGRELGRVCSGI